MLGVFIVSSIEIPSVSTPDEATVVSNTASTVAFATTEEATKNIAVEEDSVTEATTKPVINITDATSNESSYCSSATSDSIDDVSEYELDLVARTIYQEAGICGEYCQWLVGSTILNLADECGGVENVVFDYDKFNVAYVLYSATPSDSSYAVARRVLSGDRDYNVKAFRNNYYHDFGTPYTSVDNVYFSTY